MSAGPGLGFGVVGGEAAVTLRGRDLEATFLPGLGMVGASLRHRGDELLAGPGGLRSYRGGHPARLPLLHPWANRLSSRRYRVGGVGVDLRGVPLGTDPHGLPIHGTMLAARGWRVVRAEAGDRGARLSARFDFAGRPDLLRSFPFPHELEVDAVLEASTLKVTTTVRATGARSVPLSFGWHPYFRLPGAARRSWVLELPARRHLALDPRGLPTGEARAEGAEAAPIGSRTFDDLYALGRRRVLGLQGAGHRLTVEFDGGYPFAQVYAPPRTSFACLEPMAAPTNALVDGGYRSVPPGRSAAAAFTVTVE